MWSVGVSPNPGVVENQLNAVTCTDPTNCVAVGITDNGGGTLQQTLVEVFNGTTWSVVASPDVSPQHNDVLNSISCISSSDCVAVGSDYEATLVTSWDGAKWSIVSSPSPYQGGSPLGNSLNGVTCTGASRCQAVGVAGSTDLVESLDGTSWTVTQLGSGGTLTGVSCLSAIRCVAVGWAGQKSRTLVETGPHGYWLVASDGGIFTFGDAGFYGSAGSTALNQPIVGMAATPDGGGLLAGGLRRRHLHLRRRRASTARRAACTSTSPSSAWPPPPTARATGSWPPTAGSSPSATPRFYGSTGGIRLNDPIVGMAATPDGKGYWLVASDGGIFTFGDAGFYGSTGGITSTSPSSAWPPPPTAGATGSWRPTAASSPSATPASTARRAACTSTSPIVGMAATPDGEGYWLVASDGGIFTFGDAGFYGSAGSLRLNEPIVGMAGY